jgi:type IV pilus assembly protein PilA
VAGSGHISSGIDRRVQDLTGTRQEILSRWEEKIMNAGRLRMGRKCAKGFSLVELAVVVIIIGVLAAFGIPRMTRSIERSKAAEAFQYLAAVRAAQERYQAREGAYAAALTDLDVEQSVPKYFSVGTIGTGSTGSLQDSWSLTLTRQGASAGYGAYTVTFTEGGYDAANSSIEAQPHINPMGA